MQQQLDELKVNPDTANSPECKNLEDELELRSVQIQDIQQKLLDSDEGNKYIHIFLVESIAFYFR